MPMEVELKLYKEDSLQIEKEKTKMVNIPYQNVVGSWCMPWLAQRLDIAYVVNLVVQYLLNLGEKHWLATKRIIRYLKGMMGKRLIYRRTDKPLLLQGYSDVDWVGDIDTRRSTTRYYFFLANEVVRWISKKQKIAALLSTKSEYMALSWTSTKAIWIRRLLASLDLKKENPTIIHLDNQSAIALIENLKFHARNKHIDVQVHFVKEQVQAKDIKVEY